MNQSENLEEVLYQRLREVREQLYEIDITNCLPNYSDVISLLDVASSLMYRILQEKIQINTRGI